MNTIVNLRTPATPGGRIAYVRRLLDEIYRECSYTEIVSDDGKCNTLARVTGDGDDWLQIVVQEKSTAEAWLQARRAGRL